MAKGAVKLSILSSYNSSGSDQAEKALEKFAKKYGQVSSETKSVTLDESSAAFARQSIAADQAAAKLEKFGGHCTSVGGSLTKGVTVPLAAAATLTVSAASNMESSFANVRKTLDTTDEGYQRLYNSCIEMSKVHPISAADVAQVMSLGAQLGITEDNLSSFAEVVYGLDIATDLDADTAATELAQFANICGTSQGELSRVASTVVELGNTSATTESNIMNMGMRIAASGTQAGMTEANILAISAALSSLGMEAEAGGTAMSNTINQIDKDVATNGANMQTWASLAGMSVDQFAAAWKAGGDTTTDAFARVVQGMASTSEEGGNLTVLLEELGITGIRQSDAMKRLASSGDLLTTSISNANSAYSENTALSNEVANFEDTLANKLTVLKNKFTAAAIEAGGPLCDALSDVIDDMEPLLDAVSGAAKAFADMDSTQQKAVLSIAAVAAATGPALIGIGKLATAGSSVLKVYAQVTAALAKFTAAQAASGTASATLSTATGKVGTALQGMLSATNLAKLGVAALGVAVVGFAVSQAAEYIQAQKEMQTATKGLETAQLSAVATSGVAAQSAQQLIDKTGQETEAVKEATTAWGENFSAVDSAAQQAASAASRVDALRKSQANLATTLQESFATVYAGNASLDTYMSTIQSLAGKTGLTAQEQAQLKVAVDQVNSACGTSYTVLDAENGKLGDQATQAEVTADAIKKVVEAKKLSAQYDAVQDAYTQTLKSQQEAAQALAEAQAAAKTAQEDYSRAQQAGIQDTSLLAEELIKANGKVSEAQQYYDSATAACSGYNGQLTLLQMAEQQGTESNAAFIAQHSQVGAIMSANGQDVSSFAQSLDNAGVHMQDFGNVGDDVLTSMASNWDGSLLSLAQTCQQRGIEIPQSLKNGILTSSWEVTSATGAMKDALVLELAGGDVALAANLLGHDIDEGLKQGILDGTSGPQDAISSMSEEAKNKAKEMWDSHSPSVFMYNLGGDIDQGLANGITGNAAPITDAVTSVMDGAQKLMSDASTNAQRVGEGLSSWFSQGIGNLIGTVTGQAGRVASSAVSSAQGSSNASSAGSKLSSTFAGGISTWAASSSAGSLARNATSSASSNANAWWIGSNMSTTFANGINVTAAVNRAASLAYNALRAAKNALGIHSPSREFKALARYSVDGFTGGFDQYGGQAADASEDMALNALAAAQDAVGGGVTIPVGYAASSSGAEAQRLAQQQQQQQQQQVLLLQSVEGLLQDIAAKDGNVYLDGAKVSQTLTSRALATSAGRGIR